MIGFKMNEIMVGAHRFEGGDAELPMLFHLTWGRKSLREYCSPSSPDFLKAEAKGIITVEGLVHKAECEGSLHLLYFTGSKVRYELAFEDGQGRAYEYVGEKVTSGRTSRPHHLLARSPNAGPAVSSRIRRPFP